MLLLVCYNAAFAQTPTPDNTFRRVYWLHDINEENVNSTASNPQSDFWKNYSGVTRVTRPTTCPTPEQGFFLQTYKMDARPLSYYSDKPSPLGPYSVEDASGTPILRNIAKNSSTAPLVSEGLKNRMASEPYGAQPRPFVIAQGAGSLLASDIHRRFAGDQLIGGIISIGGAHQGIPLIASVDNGAMDRFDKTMRKAFDGGFDKFIEKRDSKTFSTIVSVAFSLLLPLGGLGTGPLPPGLDPATSYIWDLATLTVNKVIDKLGDKFVEKTILFLAGLQIAEDNKGRNQFVNYFGNVETVNLFRDPKAFNQYVKFAYGPKERPLLQDLRPNTTFSATNFEVSTTATIPTVSINGTLNTDPREPSYQPVSYFQVSQTAKWQNQTRNQCIDINTRPRQFEAQERLGQNARNSYMTAFRFLANEHKNEYINHATLMEGIKLGASTVGGGIKGGLVGAAAGFVVGGIFGTVGMIQAHESAREIESAFLAGEQWCAPNGAGDLGWLSLIGAYKEVIGTELRPVLPSGSSQLTDLETDADGNIRLVEVEVKRLVRVPNDGILSTDTQLSPQEQAWNGRSSTTGLNLEANKVDHFSQANHPTVRRQIERTLDSETTSSTQIRTAFRTERKG